MINLPSRKQYRKSTVQPVRVAHHWGTTVLGVIAAVVLLVCALAQTTVLNESFMVNQIASSQVGQEVKNDINASLSSYGIDDQIITTKQTNRLLKQAVHQIYEGKNIRLDMSGVMGNVEDKAGNTLSSYGVPSSVINSLPTGSLNDQVSSIVNSRINNDDVTELEGWLRTLRLVTIIGLILSVIVLLLIVIRDAVAKTVVRDFRWVTLLSGIVSAGLVMVIKPVLQSYASDYASFSNVINQISGAILNVGWQMVLVDLGLAVVLFIISLVFHHHKA